MKSFFKLLLIGICAFALLTGLSFAEEKSFSGVKVVFFNGGSKTCPFASVVYKGAQAAEKDLGCDVEYIWSDWDSKKMAAQLKEVIEKKPDAICMMGHPGYDALNSLIDEAERKGIIVTLQNVDIPEIREKYTDNGFGYVGQGLASSGLLLGKGLVRKFRLKEGDVAVVIGVDAATQPIRHERTQGAIDGLKKGGLTVHEVTMTPEVEGDTAGAAAQKMFADIVAKYPDVKVIVTDHGGLTSVSPAMLKKLGKKPGAIIVGGFDLSSDTVAGIKSGYIALVHDQQPFLQGYMPVLQVCMTKKFKFGGLFIDTGVGLVDKSNVGPVADLAAQKIR